MPQSPGRPVKEGKTERKRNPRGRPKLDAAKVATQATEMVKGGGMSENHAKFGLDEPCRVTVHWKDGFDLMEVVCKSYSLSHGVLYLATKVGEEVVPLANVRRFAVVRA